MTFQNDPSDLFHLFWLEYQKRKDEGSISNNTSDAGSPAETDDENPSAKDGITTKGKGKYRLESDRRGEYDEMDGTWDSDGMSDESSEEGRVFEKDSSEENTSSGEEKSKNNSDSDEEMK